MLKASVQPHSFVFHSPPALPFRPLEYGRENYGAILKVTDSEPFH